MTTNVVRNGPDHQFPGALKEIIIGCDQIDCDVSVTDAAVREGGGLKNMGWQVAPADGELHHYCPAHHRN